MLFFYRCHLYSIFFFFITQFQNSHDRNGGRTKIRKREGGMGRFAPLLRGGTNFFGRGVFPPFFGGGTQVGGVCIPHPLFWGWYTSWWGVYSPLFWGGTQVGGVCVPLFWGGTNPLPKRGMSPFLGVVHKLVGCVLHLFGVVHKLVGGVCSPFLWWYTS